MQILFLKKTYRKEIFDMVNTGVTRKSTSRDPGNTKVMILRRGNKAVGVFSDYIVFLGQIEEAVSIGYVPIIDRQTTALTLRRCSLNRHLKWSCKI